MVAAVAAPGEWIGRGLSFEVGAGHVVEQQLVVEREQLAQAPLEMLLQTPLVRQQPVERPVQTVVVDPLHRHPREIRQRRPPVPILGNVQLARRLAQPRNHQDRRHRRPRHLLATRRHLRGAKPIELQRLPQSPAQPDVAKTPRPFQANLLQPNRHRLAHRRGRLEQLVLLAPAGDLQRQPPSPRSTVPVELAQMCNRLLHHPATTTHRPHQTPVGVRLAVLADRRVP